MNKRYLLCQPVGGFADTIKQLNKYFEYALKHNRIFVIDTSFIGAGLIGAGLNDHFDNYFTCRDKAPHYEKIVLRLDSALKEKFKNLSVYPKFLQKLENLNYNYKLRLAPPTERIISNMFVENNSGLPIAFDFNLEYSEDLLIQSGTSNQHATTPFMPSSQLLSSLKFCKTARDTILKKINILKPLTYQAIHIRNTDLESDYKKFFQQIYNKIKGKRIFICSDSNKCMQYAKNNLTDVKLLHLDSIRSDTLLPLHFHSFANTQARRYDINIDMLADLCALSFSTKIHTPRLKKTTSDSQHYSFISGYARIAACLGGIKMPYVPGLITLNEMQIPICQYLGVRDKELNPLKQISFVDTCSLRIYLIINKTYYLWYTFRRIKIVKQCFALIFLSISIYFFVSYFLYTIFPLKMVISTA